MSELSEIVRRLANPFAYPAVLATLVEIEGSSYRRRGARLLRTADGELTGSISGGCLEEDLSARAAQLGRSGGDPTELVIYDTTSENDLVWGVGLGCRGIVRILLERFTTKPGWVDEAATALHSRRRFSLAVNWSPEQPETVPGTSLPATNPAPNAATAGCLIDCIKPPVHLAIFGAGDDAIPLTRLAADLGWTITVSDPRPAKATAARFPAAGRTFAAPAEEAPATIEWDDRTVAVVMTHHYRFDVPLIRVLAQLHLPYLGLLGPRDRGERIALDANVTPNNAPTIHSPVGLDLGGDGANAVALAIVAEIHAVIHQRDAAPLSGRSQSIHAH